MHAETEVVGDTVVVTLLEPRLDGARGLKLRQKVAELAAGGTRSILLDLTAVEFVDSTGLGAIVSSLKLLGKGGRFQLCGLSQPVRVLLRLTRMDQVFKSFARREDALMAAGSPCSPV
jgi:anti-sigma B factor antagonist